MSTASTAGPKSENDERSRSAPTEPTAMTSGALAGVCTPGLNDPLPPLPEEATRTRPASTAWLAASLTASRTWGPAPTLMLTTSTAWGLGAMPGTSKPAAQRIAWIRPSTVPSRPLSSNTLRGRMRTPGPRATPLTPTPLSPTAAAIPATWVPCSASPPLGGAGARDVVPVEEVATGQDAARKVLVDGVDAAVDDRDGHRTGAGLDVPGLLEAEQGEVPLLVVQGIVRPRLGLEVVVGVGERDPRVPAQRLGSCLDIRDPDQVGHVLVAGSNHFEGMAPPDLARSGPVECWPAPGSPVAHEKFARHVALRRVAPWLRHRLR